MLYLGLLSEEKIELPKGGCLFIGDQLPEVPEWRHPRIFDINKNHINPLRGMNDRKAMRIARALYQVEADAGKETLTVRNGRRALAKYLKKDFKTFAKLESHLWAKATDEDKKFSPTDAEVLGMVSDVLYWDSLKRIFSDKPDFTFNKNSTNLVRLDRSEMDDNEALTLAFLIMLQFKGTVVIPDFGFYGREFLIPLIKENRLVAGVKTLEELSPRLRQAVLLIKEKVPCQTTYEDAVTLARYARLKPDPTRQDNPYTAFIEAAMA
ncbi:MAG TPA: hypothetical protein VKW08_00420 [Xanthobacteraceae bacterium]|nr:hypothetical protein [Xanthobacteraceae bacterium]